MKRIFKHTSKRGFTLLEVMLATAIMTILSVMIMKGFLSTMNYAHNNNIYNKMGAKNYKSALNKVTTMVSYGKGEGLQNRINALKSEGTADTINLNFAIGGGGVSSRTMSIRRWEFDDNTGVNVASIVTTEFNEGSSVSHRHSFFFQPLRPSCPNDSAHRVRYCVIPDGSSPNGWYCRTQGCPYYSTVVPAPTTAPTATPET